jgi:hypothetical protein
MDMEMQHGYGSAAWTWICRIDMDMHHGHGHAALKGTCSTDTDKGQYGHGHGHAACIWTHSMDMAYTINMDMRYQHGHTTHGPGHEAWTCGMDMEIDKHHGCQKADKKCSPASLVSVSLQYLFGYPCFFNFQRK